MPNEATVDLDVIETRFENKLTAKETEIATLKAQLDEFNKSSTKAALDSKDAEINKLREQVGTLTKIEADSKTLLEQRGTEIKTLNDKVGELTESLKIKSEAFDKATKEVAEAKAKQVLASRISAYRTKSNDTESKDEDLAKKFGELTDEAFNTVMEFVAPKQEAVKIDEAKAAEMAKNAVVTANKTVASTTVIAPTATTTNTDPMAAKAAKLAKLVASQLFGETKETK